MIDRALLLQGHAGPHSSHGLFAALMADADDVQDNAVEVAQGPQSVTGDGWSATSHDPVKLLDVADRLRAQAASAGTARGLLFTKLQPPGAV